jgi:hypothetical protein
MPNRQRNDISVEATVPGISEPQDHATVLMSVADVSVRLAAGLREKLVQRAQPHQSFS